ncbi:MAG: superoxide dismutase family protein [Dorea sp.]
MFRIEQKPIAYAVITGSDQYPMIKGRLDLYDTYGGTLLVVGVYGLDTDLANQSHGFLGFHIHEGGSCSGNAQDPFADAKGHYNPKGVEHPLHAGDLPPLFVHGGIAWMALYTGRFHPEDVIGRTVIIHGMSDDFQTQPSGNSGMKVACGEIKAWEHEIR